MAYEFVPVMGSLSLAAGKQTITLSITNAPAGKPILAFRSLGLLSVIRMAARMNAYHDFQPPPSER